MKINCLITLPIACGLILAHHGLTEIAAAVPAPTCSPVDEHRPLDGKWNPELIKVSEPLTSSQYLDKVGRNDEAGFSGTETVTRYIAGLCTYGPPADQVVVGSSFSAAAVGDERQTALTHRDEGVATQIDKDIFASCFSYDLRNSYNLVASRLTRSSNDSDESESVVTLQSKVDTGGPIIDRSLTKIDSKVTLGGTTRSCAYIRTTLTDPNTDAMSDTGDLHVKAVRPNGLVTTHVTNFTYRTNGAGELSAEFYVKDNGIDVVNEAVSDPATVRDRFAKEASRYNLCSLDLKPIELTRPPSTCTSELPSPMSTPAYDPAGFLVVADPARSDTD